MSKLPLPEGKENKERRKELWATFAAKCGPVFHDHVGRVFTRPSQELRQYCAVNTSDANTVTVDSPALALAWLNAWFMMSLAWIGSWTCKQKQN